MRLPVIDVEMQGNLTHAISSWLRWATFNYKNTALIYRDWNNNCHSDSFYFIKLSYFEKEDNSNFKKA